MTTDFSPAELAGMRRLIRCFVETFDSDTSVQQLNDVLALVYRLEAKVDQKKLIDRATYTLGGFTLCTRCGKFFIDPNHFTSLDDDPVCSRCLRELEMKARGEKFLD